MRGTVLGIYTDTIRRYAVHSNKQENGVTICFGERAASSFLTRTYIREIKEIIWHAGKIANARLIWRERATRFRHKDERVQGQSRLRYAGTAAGMPHSTRKFFVQRAWKIADWREYNVKNYPRLYRRNQITHDWSHNYVNSDTKSAGSDLLLRSNQIVTYMVCSKNT